MSNFRNTFKKQQFNLSSEWRFNYDDSSGSLSVEKNKLHLEDFFKLPDAEKDNGRVINVTGVVGKNGAGKTTVLDFIKENLVEGAVEPYSPALIVVANGTSRLIYAHQTLPLQGNYKEYGFKVVNYGNEEKRPNITPLENTTVVFFSNIFDTKSEKEWMGMRNISTNYLVVHSKLKALQLKRVHENFSETTYYRREEILKQLRLIRRNHNHDFSLPILMPDRVLILPNTVAMQVEQISERDKKKLSMREQKANILQQNVHQWLAEKHLNAKNIDSIKTPYFIAAINTFLYEISNFDDYLLSDSFLNLRNTYQKNIDPALSTYNQLSEFVHKILDIFIEEKEPEFAIERVRKFLNFLQVLDESITEDNIAEGNRFSLPTSHQGNGRDILSFVDTYADTVGFLSFLEFEWQDLSSGQKALLSTYARFYSISDEVERIENTRLKKNVLILIDEGELFLHPEWQKGFLAGLLSFLPKIYKERNIQVVLTSNSPFIASDLPNSNLIFIDKTAEGCEVIDGLSEDKQTFAANIHTLLSDAFFMKKGLIGDFAAHKVNKLIGQIKNNGADILVSKRESIEALISQIGEPVLRSKLYSMYREKTSLYFEKDSINEQLLDMVKELQRELKQLKDERNK
ncbi:AAA family ATPase [Paenibacillus sp. NPDC058174]|uniref:AAA family ATPase n=1 Tax=Paenibacillus sp. NPDC058174 TaxID=3346366 RepID=UPI0036DAEF9E